MNYLIFGDLHITQNSLKECQKILNEIIILCDKYSVTHIIDLGDTYDNLKPSSQELDLFSNFIKDLNRPITIVTANSHESETEQISIMNHFGVLNSNVKIVKEYKDGHHLYCGHFILTESNINYGAKLSKESLKNFAYVFLGHQHSYQVIKPNICHLGSTRYVSFAESSDKNKVVVLIENYGTDKEEVHFLGLKSPIPMKEIELGQNVVLDGSKDTPKAEIALPRGSDKANLRQFNSISAIMPFLDNLDQNTKVKVKIMDFESFRQFLPLCSKYDTKFATFKYETQFEIISINNQNCKNMETKTFKESFHNWLSKQLNIDSKIKEILQKEIE